MQNRPAYSLFQNIKFPNKPKFLNDKLPLYERCIISHCMIESQVEGETTYKVNIAISSDHDT